MVINMLIQGKCTRTKRNSASKTEILQPRRTRHDYLAKAISFVAKPVYIFYLRHQGTLLRRTLEERRRKVLWTFL